MSGGTWGYKQFEIQDMATRTRAFLDAVAKTERIIDWSEANDTLRKDAEREVYDLWVQTFNEVYGSF